MRSDAFIRPAFVAFAAACLACRPASCGKSDDGAAEAGAAGAFHDAKPGARAPGMGGDGGRLAGEPVAEAEWDLFLEPERAAVFAWFRKRYGAEDSPDFWDRDFNGDKPGEMLRARARKNLVRIKIEQKLARREGLIADIGWDAFERDLSAENRRRAEALAKGAVIYGPTVLDARSYYLYRQSNLIIRLKESLARKGLEPGEAALRSAYDSLKAGRFSDDTARIETYRLTPGPGGGNAASSKSRLRRAASALADCLEANRGSERCANEAPGKAVMETISFPLQARGEEEDTSGVAWAARHLRPGQAKVLSEGESRRVVFCRDIRNGSVPYAQVRAVLRKQLLDAAFQRTIDSLSALQSP